jgi:hypothetical protein
MVAVCSGKSGGRNVVARTDLAAAFAFADGRGPCPRHRRSFAKPHLTQ